jgi:hypothetical protein
MAASIDSQSMRRSFTTLPYLKQARFRARVSFETKHEHEEFERIMEEAWDDGWNYRLPIMLEMKLLEESRARRADVPRGAGQA